MLGMSMTFLSQLHQLCTVGKEVQSFPEKHSQQKLPIEWKSSDSATECRSCSSIAIASSNLIFATAFSHSLSFFNASGSLGTILWT
jgi:hypothetical protein